MSKAAVCRCPACRVASSFWPLMLITVGVVILLANLRPDFDNWVGIGIVVLVAGAVKLAASLAPAQGHL